MWVQGPVRSESFQPVMFHESPNYYFKLLPLYNLLGFPLLE